VPDKILSDTITYNTADKIIASVGGKYTDILSAPDRKEKLNIVVTEALNHNVNPAILTAMWVAEASAAAEHDDAAFGYGVYGGVNRYPGFNKQTAGGASLIRKAVDNVAPYNEPSGENAWTRLFYNYVAAAMKDSYDEKGYVSDADEARYVIIKRFYPSEATCTKSPIMMPGSVDGTKAEVIKRINATAGGSGTCSSVNLEARAGSYSSDLDEITVRIWKYNGGSAPIDSSMVLTVNPNCTEVIKAIFTDIYNDPSHPQIDPSQTTCAASRDRRSNHVIGAACDVNADQNWCAPNCYNKTNNKIGDYWKPGDESPNKEFKAWSEGYDPRSIGINSPIANAFRKHNWGRGLYRDNFDDMMHFSFDGH